MAAAEAAKSSAMSLGELAASGALGNTDHSHVSSGSGVASGGNNGGKGVGLDSSIGGGTNTGIHAMLSASKIHGFEGASIDSMLHFGDALGSNPLDHLDNAGPFKLSAGPVLDNIQSETLDLKYAAFIEESGAKIQGNTGILSQSGGQGH